MFGHDRYGIVRFGSRGVVSGSDSFAADVVAAMLGLDEFQVDAAVTEKLNLSVLMDSVTRQLISSTATMTASMLKEFTLNEPQGDAVAAAQSVSGVDSDSAIRGGVDLSILVDSVIRRLISSTTTMTASVLKELALDLTSALTIRKQISASLAADVLARALEAHDVSIDIYVRPGAALDADGAVIAFTLKGLAASVASKITETLPALVMTTVLKEESLSQSANGAISGEALKSALIDIVVERMQRTGIQIDLAAAIAERVSTLAEIVISGERNIDQEISGAAVEAIMESALADVATSGIEKAMIEAALAAMEGESISTLIGAAVAKMRGIDQLVDGAVRGMILGSASADSVVRKIYESEMETDFASRVKQILAAIADGVASGMETNTIGVDAAIRKTMASELSGIAAVAVARASAFDSEAVAEIERAAGLAAAAGVTEAMSAFGIMDASIAAGMYASMTSDSLAVARELLSIMLNVAVRGSVVLKLDAGGISIVPRWLYYDPVLPDHTGDVRCPCRHADIGRG